MITLPKNKSFDRLLMLWERYPKYHNKSISYTLEELLSEHESYQKDFDENLRKEYIENGYEKFNIRLSWNDLPYRYETKQIIEKYDVSYENRYVYEFISQFAYLDYENNAYFIFSESYTSQYFVITEVCKSAKQVTRINNMFSDEKAVHYLAVFDKNNVSDVLLMFHLIYSGGRKEITGGYSLYDYDVSWYQSHLIQDDVVMRSPFLPDKLSKYLGNISMHMNPAKTVYVRRNISHILECGYFESELEVFLQFTEILMGLEEYMENVREALLFWCTKEEVDHWMKIYDGDFQWYIDKDFSPATMALAMVHDY